MSQQTQPTEPSPILPIIVFLAAVGIILFMLLPRPPQRPAEAGAETPETASVEAPTAVAAEPTTVPTTAPAEVTEAAPAEVTEAAPAEAAEVPAEFDAAVAYNWACASCHGADGRGVEGYGPSLLFSSDVMGRNISGLVRLFNVAQPPTNPELGFVHPYRGGYPELNDEQLGQLMDYLFTLAAG
ncbi:MAG: cytochrome c [Anaerolineae bacterium]